VTEQPIWPHEDHLDAAAASNRIGPYEVIRILGRSDVEVRSLARDTRRDKLVELQMLPLVLGRRRAVVERLAHLAEAQRQLRHPHLVRLVRFEADRERPDLVYLVWEHVPGATLAELIQQSPDGLPVDRVLAWAEQLAGAVDYLDDLMPGHGGINPGNVIIDENDQAWLGGAVVWREVRREYRRLVGRRGAAGLDGLEDDPSIDEREQDIRDLASTLYAALHGVVASMDEGQPAPIAGLTAQVNMTLLEALEPDGGSRFLRASDLVRSLEGATLQAELPAALPTARRRSGARSLIFMTMLIIATVATWLWAGRPQAPRLRTPSPAASAQTTPPADASWSLTGITGGDQPASPEQEQPEATEVGDPAEVEAAVREVERLARACATLRFPTNPSVAQPLVAGVGYRRKAQQHADTADHAAMLDAHHAAAEALQLALRRDAWATTVWELGQRVVTAIDDSDLSGAAAESGLLELTRQREEAQAAFDAGRLAEANLWWRRAASLHSGTAELAALDHAAVSARSAWGERHTTWPETWESSMRREAEHLLNIAGAAEVAFRQERYEDAIAGWEEASFGFDVLIDAQQEVLCAVEEAVESWEIARSEVPVRWASDMAVQQQRDEALQMAVGAARAESDGRLVEAADAYGRAGTLMSEAIAQHRRLTARRLGDSIVNEFGMRLVYLAPGDFVMGSPAEEPGRDPAELCHPVHVAQGCWIGATEVTRSAFDAFVRDTGYRTDAEREGWSHGIGDGGRWRRIELASWRAPGFEQDPMHPVVCVSYGDALAFCRWLSEREGRVYRLPTEAEWEYACRAGTVTAYHWGDTPSAGAANTVDAASADRFRTPTSIEWSDGCMFTCPVGSYPPNGWGLHDLHGNVQEWCLDAYTAYPAYADRSSETSAVAEDASSDRSPRVLRGGSFAASPTRARAAHRDASSPTMSFATVGFRVVLEEETH
jgi:formylglycine-generating enzyme required for sulfatase activity